MKKISLIILTLVLSILYLDDLNALTGYTTETNVIIRSEPNVSSSTFIEQLPSKNIILDLVDETLHNINGDSACKIGWYKINYKGSVRYVCSKYVSIGNVPDNNPSYNDKSYEARIYGYNIYAKEQPNSSSRTKHVLLTGTNVIIEGNKISGSGCSDGWYKIKYYKNDTGYVCSSYIRKKEEITSSNAEYEQELKNAGFPDTYIPYLVKLHEMHPNWKFNAIQTGVNWNHLVSIEESKNALNNTFVNSTVRDLYSKGNYNESGWSISTDAVNAFFLDPRNFLTEKFIFMFEALGYNYGNDDRASFNRDSSSTKNYFNSVSNMLGSSYLNTDEYKYMFINAGFNYKVSPIHLVGRVIQEGGSNESYSAITGNSSLFYNGIPLKGYYNYYNIGAYKDGDLTPVERGIVYACGEKCGCSNCSNSYGRPWDTREKAIYGGAEFLAGSYISVGQNTLYFQKFDIKNATHQYQANVTAPASEGIDAFLAYQKAGLLESPIEFDIPIYTNMPEVVSLPEIASTVNTLDKILVDGELISGYDKDVVDYTVYINEKNSSALIEGAKTDSASSVIGLGTITLNEKETDHEITVTAENGSKKTYHLKLIKVVDNTSVEKILSNLSVRINGDIMNHISPDTVANTLIQSILKNSPNAKVTIYNKTGKNIDGATLIETGGSIKIIAPSGETKSYTTVVTGDTNGDGTVTILDLLRIQKHILGTTPLNNAELKAGDTNTDNKVDILDLLRVQKHILKSITL